MAHGAYEIVVCRPEHSEAVARLHAVHSTPDPAVNAAYLEWKYGRNPYLKKRHLYLALHKGAVVAMRGFYGACWETGAGAAHTIPCAADLVISPAHRDKSLFTQIMRKADDELTAEGYPFLFSFTPSAVTAVGLLAMGWKPVAGMGELRRERGARLMHRRASRWYKAHFAALSRRRAARSTIAHLSRGPEREAPCVGPTCSRISTRRQHASIPRRGLWSSASPAFRPWPGSLMAGARGPPAPSARRSLSCVAL